MAGLSLPVAGQDLRSVNAHGATLKASPTPTPSMKVDVSAGGFWNLGKSWVQFNGARSPLFVKPTTNAKWDLLVLDYNGFLQIITGTPSGSPQLPDCPRNCFPIAAIYLSHSTVAITSEVLVDVKQIFNTVSFSHRDLTEKDLPGCHSIDSVSGLQDVLNTFITIPDSEGLVQNKADKDGTPSEIFMLNKDAASAPISDCFWIVNRGEEPAVGFKWNENIKRLEYSNDGVSWSPITNSDIGIATSQIAGLVKPGTGLEITVDGVLSAITQSANDFTDELKTKLESLENYVHPASHPATMIDTDDTHLFVTADEKLAWNNKLDNLLVASDTVLGGIKIGTGLTIDENGVVTITAQTDNNYSNIDKAKVDAIDQVFTLAEKTKLGSTEIYSVDDKTKVTAIDQVFTLNEKSGLGCQNGYSVANPTNWTGNVPVTVREAIDRIAVALAALNQRP